MITETRQIATIGKIRATELKCPKHGCGGKLEIDLRPGCIDSEEQCPRCKRTWWTARKPTTTLELLRALTDMRNTRDEDPSGPSAGLILPAPETGAE